MNEVNKPTLSLALGGGGARGIAHIHVLEVLDEMGIQPVAISGSSVGAMIGAAYASGMSGIEVRKYVNDTFGNKTQFFTRLWRELPSSVGEFVSRGWPKIGELDAERVLRAFMPKQVPQEFAGLKIPLIITATDFYGQKGLNLSEGSINNAVAASIAIPAVFKPVKVNNIICIDGGIANPVPFDQLYDKANILLAIDVVGSPKGEPGEIPSRIESLFGASQLMMQTTTSMKLKIRPPEILLRPDVNSYRVHDFFKAEKILRETAYFREEVRNAINSAMDLHKRSELVN